jgi:hypothetical protein
VFRMIAWRALPEWVARAWPALAIAPIGAAHAFALDHYAPSTQLVNKLAGMGLQLIGGLLILYSINDNLGLFKRHSLVGALVGWLRSFPLVPKSVTLSVRGSSIGSFGGSASISARLAPTTLEERVDNLEQDLRVLRRELSDGLNGLQGRIDSTRNELGARIDSSVEKLNDLTNKVEQAAVGGFKVQAFGVLLAIYGAFTSVFA